MTQLTPQHRLIRLAIGGAAALYARVGIRRDDATEFLDEAAGRAWASGGTMALLRLAVTVAADLAKASVGRAALPVSRRDATRWRFTSQQARSSTMDRAMADLRYSLRGLLKTPAFTLVAVVTLALGIGASTAVYAVVDGAILRPFSYPDMDRIVILTERQRPTGQRMSVSWPNFLDWRTSQDALQELGVYRGATLNLSGQETPERLPGALVSASVFETAGIPALRGRTFSAADDEPGVGRIVIVSERFWRTRLGARDDVIGFELRLDNQPYTVVGVMPMGMRFPSRLTDVWLPLGLFVNSFPKERGNHPGLFAVGRLKPGISVDQADVSLDVIARRLEEQYPDSNRHGAITVESYYEAIVQNIRPAMRMLLGAVGLLVLIACANLASLLLARSETRQRELAIRAALGAGRGRLIRQLLAEALMLAAAGGALGVVVAQVAVQAFLATEPSTIPRVDLIAIDWRVLGFAALVSLGTVILFGVLPALRASSPDLHHSLRDQRSSSPGLRALRARRLLVAGQLAVAVVLLVGAGLFFKSFVRLQAIELGFDPSRVVTMRVALGDAKYPDVAAWTAFYDRLIERLASTAGVAALGVNSALPLEGGGSESPVIKETDPPPSPERQPAMTLFQTTGGDYFKAMGIPLMRGRTFDGRDRMDSQRVVIVDESLVARLFPGQDPLGQRIAFENEGMGPQDHRPIWREIVGVVGTVRHYGLLANRPFVQLYVPHTQLPYWQRNRRPAMAIVARTTADPEAFVATVRRAVTSVDPTLPVFGVQPMRRYVDAETEASRLASGLLTGFASIALLLAVVGVYGVLSYAVSLRTREIGVRMALGARRGLIVRQVVGEGAVMALAGIVVGVGLALWFAQLLRGELYQVAPTDVTTYLVVSAVLAMVAVVASAIPARRASAVDPLIALRAE